MGCYVVMGVMGCGKTTVGRKLAQRLGGIFLDGDDFHPQANIQKMSAGIPLTDDDRWEWLKVLNLELIKHSLSGANVFLACSALRKVYRNKLSANLSGIRFIFLRGSKEEILNRLKTRDDHFMPKSLLDSQFETLEEPTSAIQVNADQSVDAIVNSVEQQILSKKD